MQSVFFHIMINLFQFFAFYRYIDLLCYAYKIQRLKKKSEKVYRQGFYLSILQQSANLQNANNMERIQQVNKTLVKKNT